MFQAQIQFLFLFIFFSNSRTLKFFKVKCNPTNKKTLALHKNHFLDGLTLTADYKNDVTLLLTADVTLLLLRTAVVLYATI